MTIDYPTPEATDAAQAEWNHKIDCQFSQSDSRIVREVHRDGLSITLELEIQPDKFTSGEWVPLEIKRLFTSSEWAAAKAIAVDTWENLALTFEPIPSEIVVQHLRTLVPSVLTEARFTEITGRTY